jgi:hypothetical protein
MEIRAKEHKKKGDEKFGECSVYEDRVDGV